MADDIVERLRCTYTDDGCGQCTFCLAKNEIERLRQSEKNLCDFILWGQHLIQNSEELAEEGLI